MKFNLKNKFEIVNDEDEFRRIYRVMRNTWSHQRFKRRRTTRLDKDYKINNNNNNNNNTKQELNESTSSKDDSFNQFELEFKLNNSNHGQNFGVDDYDKINLVFNSSSLQLSSTRTSLNEIIQFVRNKLAR